MCESDIRGNAPIVYYQSANLETLVVNQFTLQTTTADGNSQEIPGEKRTHFEKASQEYLSDRAAYNILDLQPGRDFWTRIEGERRINAILRDHGHIDDKVKSKMLEIWLKGNGNYKSQSMVHVIESGSRCEVEKILQTHEIMWNSAPDAKGDLYAKIISAVPDDDWLEFVRVELDFTVQEIGEIREKFCQLTREQKYQILMEWTSKREIEMKHGEGRDSGEDNRELTTE